MVKLLILGNIIDPIVALSDIIPRLQVEKRNKSRPLQMSSLLS